MQERLGSASSETITSVDETSNQEVDDAFLRELGLTTQETVTDILSQLQDHFGERVFTYGKYSGTVTDMANTCPAFSFQMGQGLEAAAAWLESHDGQQVEENTTDVLEEEAHHVIDEKQQPSNPEPSSVNQDASVEAKVVASLHLDDNDTSSFQRLHPLAVQTSGPAPDKADKHSPQTANIKPSVSEKMNTETTKDERQIDTLLSSQVVINEIPEINIVTRQNSIPAAEDAQPTHHDVSIYALPETSLALDLATTTAENWIINDTVSEETIPEVNDKLYTIPSHTEEHKDNELLPDENHSSKLIPQAGTDLYKSNVSREIVKSVDDTTSEQTELMDVIDEYSLVATEQDEVLWPVRNLYTEDEAEKTEVRENDNEISETADGVTNNQTVTRITELEETSLDKLLLNTGEQIENNPENPEKYYEISSLDTAIFEPINHLTTESPDLPPSATIEDAMYTINTILQKIQLLEKATSADECNEAITLITKELSHLLQLIGFSNADSIAYRLIRQYDIATIKHYIQTLLQTFQQPLAGSTKTIQFSYSEKPRHLYGMHAVKTMVDLTFNTPLRQAA